MEKDEQAKREAGDSEKLNAAAAASAAAPAADGGFDDVMKMIEARLPAPLPLSLSPPARLSARSSLRARQTCAGHDPNDDCG